MSYTRISPQSDLALFQASGVGDYEHTGDWSWMFYPFAYSFLAPSDSAPLAPIRYQGLSGDCGCGCGGNCGGCPGLGQTGLLGTGLFSTSDISQWGWGEWVTIAGGIWVLGSALGDVKRAGRAGQRAYKAARSNR